MILIFVIYSNFLYTRVQNIFKPGCRVRSEFKNTEQNRTETRTPGSGQRPTLRLRSLHSGRVPRPPEVHLSSTGHPYPVPSSAILYEQRERMGAGSGAVPLPGGGGGQAVRIMVCPRSSSRDTCQQVAVGSESACGDDPQSGSMR